MTNDRKTSTTEDPRLDRQLRELHTAAIDAEAADAIEARSRATTRIRLRRQSHELQKGRGRNRLRILVPAMLVSVAVSIGVALAPGGGSGGEEPGSVSISGLTDSASAAEALAWAGKVLVESGDAAGSGSAWHGVSRAYLDGELISVTEQWFGPTRRTYLAAAWGEQDVPEQQRELLQVVSIDADGTSRLRTYDKPRDADAWQLPDELPSPHLVQELPAGYGAGQRVLASAVQEWLKVAESEPSRQQLIAATDRFGELTRNQYFGGQAPEFERATMARSSTELDSPEAQEEMHEQVKAGADALRVRPMLYLLTSVQATPEATQALYDQIGRFDSLERLSNVSIDGREAIRIRYDGVDLGTHRERVLVIDAESGAPVRTESVNRKSWTAIDRARRVADVGEGSALCDDEHVPCELLRGTGPLAKQWMAHVTSEIGRRTTQFMKDPDNAFAIAVPLRPADSDDSVYGAYTGECSRDARMLSVCRG